MSVMKRILAAAAFLAMALLPPVVSADDGDREYRFITGIVMRLESSSIIVNEGKRVEIVYDTRFYDSSGAETGMHALGEQRWVYIEGVPKDGRVEAERVYVLDGPPRKGKKRYDFIQAP